MATTRTPRKERTIEYPTSDGKPMAETDEHRKNMTDTIETLEDFQADDPNVYTSGNMLLYYVKGNKHKHISPDVFTSKDVEKRLRDCYLVWEEGKGPDAAMEFTSKSTRHEDLVTKFRIYRDILKVKEYFLFDPKGDYLEPRLQGYRLRGGQYVKIRPVNGRLPSQVLGLHLEADGSWLRLWDPRTGQRLLTPREKSEQAEEERRRAEEERRRAEEERDREQAARIQAEAEIARLRQQLEALRRDHPGPTGSD